MIPLSRRFAAALHSSVVAITLVALLAACSGPVGSQSDALATLALGPATIALPDGFQPEGVATGDGPELFAGSLANGEIVRLDLRSGASEVLVPGAEGRVAVGMNYDVRSGLLWVAGGPTGGAHAYDASTGAEAAAFDFAGGFVNDVIVTRTGAWFTDSFAPVLYRVSLDDEGRPLGDAATVPLAGDYAFIAGGFNANGIEATPSGDALIVVNSTTGTLYAVDPSDGVATEIDLGGDTLTAGDGILLDGPILYVVRNQLNLIAAVHLSPDLSSGAVVATITNDGFDIPTTVAKFGSSLYAVNARFGTPPTPDTPYDVVRVDGVSATGR